MSAMMESMEHTILRYSKMTIFELENELKSNLNSVAVIFDIMIRSGRINGDARRMNSRVEEEMIKTFREHFVR